MVIPLSCVTHAIARQRNHVDCSFQTSTSGRYVHVLLLNPNESLTLDRGPRLCVEILGIPAGRADPTTSINEQNKYKQIFSSRAVQLVAFFCWVYVGVEVTIGGNVPPFVLEPSR